MEQELADDIFNRLSNVPLIDKYEAYQFLDEAWNKIAIDLEMIQTEGFETVKKVDPNMVLKKKKGKDEEIQDGWIGHVLPFDLVQDVLLTDIKKEWKEKEDRLAEIGSEYEELIDSLTEEEKEADFINDAKDSFVTAELKKALKSDDMEQETMEKLRTANALITEEKSVKAEMKTLSTQLESKTKETIESLTDERAVYLLKEKWITSLVESMMKLPDHVINNLVSEIERLAKKYETTFEQIEKEIVETEQSLCAMINELCGNESDMVGLNELKKLLGGK